MSTTKASLQTVYDRYLLLQIVIGAIMAFSSFLPMSFNKEWEAIRAGAGTMYFYPGLDPKIGFSFLAPVALSAASYWLTVSPIPRTLAALVTIPLAGIAWFATSFVGYGGADPLIGCYVCKYAAVALALLCLGHVPFCMTLLTSRPAA